MKPPEINIPSHWINHTIVKENGGPVDKEGREVLKQDGNTAFEGGDRVPEVDPEIHETGAP